ncbi:hypothetical protein IMZ11_41415 [Microtetraspora sp. AC03309]|uniref:hypothetical protein n=1 Tax=Microtetraspora sp. AC03309 TaxID=2779376 RepID=UPI001E3A027F|nr:hypothetical protein [Microtetraspora sp. AC03309]MCC5582076.1 hypothetical protein [Microtetraspora sp. AC03309]
MTVNPVAAAAAELAAVAAGYAPASMWQVAADLDEIAAVDGFTADALRTYSRRLDGEYPIDPVVLDALEDLAKAHAGLVAMAEEIGVLFRQVHSEDLRRAEAPRTGEHMWNVDGQGHGGATASKPSLCADCPADCTRRTGTN